MNKKIILHIGLYKTGSSFIQKFLESNKNESYVLFTRKDKLIFYLKQYLENQSDLYKKEILKIISNYKKTILISSESIFGHQSNGFRDTSKRFKLLEDLFSRPNYIIFFRKPSSIIYSGFFQGLKKNHNLKLEDYCNVEINKLKKLKIPKNFTYGNNYKLFDYNILFYDYLKIQERTLFVEFEKFFYEKKIESFNNFIGNKFHFDFNKKINFSNKKLIYLEFYNKFKVFRLLYKLIIKFNKLFLKKRKNKHITFELVIIINLLNFFLPKNYTNQINNKNRIILDKIDVFHASKYKKFKNRLTINQ